MAETNAHTEVPAGGKEMFPPFQRETFPSQLFWLGITFIIRVKAGTNVSFQGKWCKLGKLGFRGNEHHRSFGALAYCERCPQRLWVSKSRARDAKGNWGIWHLVSNRPSAANAAAHEYGRRFGCEEGFRDAKWWLGFAKARIAQIKAWSRMFALFAIAFLVMTSLGSHLLLAQGQGAKAFSVESPPGAVAVVS